MEIFMTIAQTFGSSLSTIVQHPNFFFIFLFIFRYLRFVVLLVGYYLYHPSPVHEPCPTEKDCTVIIPTCSPEDPAFLRCVESIVQTYPSAIHIVTVGKEQEKQAWSIIAPFVSSYPEICFKVSHSPQANKRRQVAVALGSVKTPITVLCDDHVIWPSPNLLRAAAAPFGEDASIGGVGTNKRVIRRSETSLWQGFWNVLGALYLERHNIEHTSSNAIDGGVLVVSGRTCLYRTQILQDPEVLAGYLNERFFFGLFGPLNADDDNYLTRALVKRGYKIKFQNTKDTMILCDVGECPKFLKQCLRWARSTFRSNMCSLVTDRSIYRTQPWAVYALQICQMLNFALFYDAALVWTLTRTNFYTVSALKVLCTWILVSKLPKIMPYFWCNPADLIYLPGYYMFAYFHSLIKLWALLTFWDIQWSGRDLHSINGATAKDQVPQDSDFPLAPEYKDFNFKPSIPLKRPVSTPWGFVAPQNSYLTPANVLQTQLAGRSWPRNWSTKGTQTYEDSGYNNCSPVVLEFEENVTAQSTPPRSLGPRTGYPTPRSTDYQHEQSNVVSPTKRPAQGGLATPPASPRFQPMSTPSHMSSTPSRSWIRADECGRLHEGYYPHRRCGY